MKRPALLILATAVACGPATTATIDSLATPPQESVPEQSNPAPGTGVLVMAHGGGPEWNQSVLDAVASAAEIVPTAVAFGMANPHTLQRALDELGARGVTRVAVVRMFLSGESFLDQTEYFLGLSDAAPSHFVLMGPAAADPDARKPIRHSMTVATHAHGILDSHHVGRIMADRAATFSTSPADEAVLLIAHGMGDDGANDRVLAAMQRVADQVVARGFADVEIATLREDWDEKRASAEEEIRAFVEENSATRSVLVLPMRLSGFGPYADVLEGLEYSAGEGLLPHEAIAEWVLETANGVTCASGWGAIANPCGQIVVEPLSAVTRDES